MMEVAVEHRQGEFALSASFLIGSGITALFGPSGAGKTSLMQIIAGLIRPDKARIIVDGVSWNDTERGIFLDAHKRRIGYVFQEGRLFPHMSVSRNLDYGRFFTPAGERSINRDEIIALLGIGHLLKARPGRLSGGEKSRVAIGRALLMSPRLLLMDEPLASLDQARKDEILPYVEKIRDHWNIPVLYVSHARSEVRRLASRVLLLEDGHIISEGDASILDRPSAQLSDRSLA